MKRRLFLPKAAAVCVCAFFFALLPAFAENGDDTENFHRVTGPCGLTFPDDHGMHAGYRNEWWYYTGNLRAPSEEIYGFQLTFFRNQISPPMALKKWPPTPSAWRTQHLFLAHAALSHPKEGAFFYAEKVARGALRLAGVKRMGDSHNIFLGNWSAHLSTRTHHLRADAKHFGFDLTLVPEKGPVLHGMRGYSLKGRKPENASCYYSLTRLSADGHLTLSNQRLPVNGTAWMDHEYSTAPLEDGLTGWDWFSIQLDNHTEIMLYALRRRQGDLSPASSGTFVSSSGQTRHLTLDNILIKVLDYWNSPRTNAVYPAKWKIRIPPLDLDLLVTPNLADQELITARSTQVTYWEGSVSVNGHSRRSPVKGVGYVELTGYAEPFGLLR
jgi:predicted secreted hydrolase